MTSSIEWAPIETELRLQDPQFREYVTRVLVNLTYFLEKQKTFENLLDALFIKSNSNKLRGLE